MFANPNLPRAPTCAIGARWNTHFKEAPRRAFDVSSFCGDPARTAAILGWREPPRSGKVSAG
jgi:hypothetical protein